MRVVDRDLGDPQTSQPLGQAGVLIELTVTGGTADSFAGITNDDGIFQTNARLFQGEPELVIEVVARAGAGGAELTRVTITSPSSSAAAGVTRTGSSGQVNAGVPGFPTGGSCLLEPFRRSPVGATEWTDSHSCTGVNASGGPEQASTMSSFTEVYQGGSLVAVSGSGSGAGSSESSGTAQYQLEFSVVESRTIDIDAQLSTSGFATVIVRLILVGRTQLINSQNPGSIHETLTLAPGNYAMAIVAGGSNGTASYDFTVTFGPAGG